MRFTIEVEEDELTPGISPGAGMTAAGLTLDSKLDLLNERIRPLERVAVAFSGGVDSTLVVAVAAEVLGPENVLAVTGVSAALADAELAEARQLAERLQVEHILLETYEAERPEYVRNASDRCYYCKTELYSRMAPLLAERQLATILNGANADDLGDHRPGMKAAKEFRVLSPLLDAGLTKAEVRQLSAARDLPTADKPAAPCLASRIAYGIAVTPGRLRQVEVGEALLRRLGLRECRLRHHDTLCRIEVPESEISHIVAHRNTLVSELRAAGFTYVTLDLSGFRSGSANDVLAPHVLQIQLPKGSHAE